MSDSTVEPFVKKELIYVQDQNGGSFNGQIQFDLSQLSNSGKWVDWSSAFLVLPFVIVSKCSGDITGSANAFMAGLKAGNHHLINSIQVDVNNKNVVQLTQFLNHYVSYKLMTSFSNDDLRKHGAGINFIPDTATSFNFSTTGADGKDGGGLSNNRISHNANAFSTATSGWKGQPTNSGFLSRLQNVMDLSTGGLATTGANASFGQISTTAGGPFLTSANAITNGKSYFTDDAGTGAARVYTWHILAKIRLKDLHSFFEKMPLSKGQFVKMTINYNASNQTISWDNTAGTAVVSSLTVTGQTNPIMVASGATNNPHSTTYSTANRTITFACGIVSATDGTNSKSNSILTSCRLYAELYSLNPTFEDQYLSLQPTKTIRYTDLYQYQITAQTGTFNALVTNGLVAPKTVIVIPYLNKASNTTLTGYPVYQSPFTTEPGTTSPFCAISNFNVQVSGLNLFAQNQSYDYEQFLTEVSPQNSINGGRSTGVASGLISYQDWQHGYRYYVADVSRRLPLDDTVPKSIQISGTVNCSKTVDLLVFIEYERSITFDMATGAVIE